MTQLTNERLNEIDEKARRESDLQTILLVEALRQSRNNETMVDAEHTEMGFQLEAAKAEAAKLRCQIEADSDVNYMLREEKDELLKELTRWKDIAQRESKAHYKSACIAEEEKELGQAFFETAVQIQTELNKYRSAVAELREVLSSAVHTVLDKHLGAETRHGYEFNSVGKATDVRKEDLQNDDNDD